MAVLSLPNPHGHRLGRVKEDGRTSLGETQALDTGRVEEYFLIIVRYVVFPFPSSGSVSFAVFVWRAGEVGWGFGGGGMVMLIERKNAESFRIGSGF